MRADDKADFQRLLTDVMAFYRQDVSPFALSVWWSACAPFELAQVRRAFTDHARDPERGQFPPKPADVVRALHGTATDRGLLAWGKLMDAMARVGAYQSVAFDDPAIHSAVMDMGGWSALCRTKSDELPFLQKRFTDLHRAYSGRSDMPHVGHLPGEFEARNALSGQRVAPPVLVGNPDRAREVIRLGVTGARTAITAAEAVPRRLEAPAEVS